MPDPVPLAERVPSLSATRDNVGDVLLTLRELDATLDPADGVRWFNVVYRMVTEAVAEDLRAGLWREPVWLESLVVSFSGLYFDALIAGDQSSDLTPHAWSPLFEKRFETGLARIQFAIAGFNAHINRDLPWALYLTAPDGEYPARTSWQYADHLRVNDVLERVEAEAFDLLAGDIDGLPPQPISDVADVLALWSIRQARESAWVNGEVLWNLDGLPTLQQAFFDRLDRLTEFAGRGILRHATG
jgi:hypothetical protein